jgi:hypothetical protein
MQQNNKRCTELGCPFPAPCPDHDRKHPKGFQRIDRMMRDRPNGATRRWPGTKKPGTRPGHSQNQPPPRGCIHPVYSLRVPLRV